MHTNSFTGDTGGWKRRRENGEKENAIYNLQANKFTHFHNKINNNNKIWVDRARDGYEGGGSGGGTWWVSANDG